MQKGYASQLEQDLLARRRAGQGYESVLPIPKAKLLDQVREILRLRHYSIRTEQCYCEWIRRYIRTSVQPRPNSARSALLLIATAD